MTRTKTTYYVISINTPMGSEARQFDTAEQAFDFLVRENGVTVLRAYKVTK
jgi:hypothetical protein